LGAQPDPLLEQEEVRDQVAPLTQPSSSARPNSSVPQLSNRPLHRSSNSAGALSNIRSFQPETKNSSIPSPTCSNLGGSGNTTSAALNLLDNEGIHAPPQTSTGTRYGVALGGTMAIDTTKTSAVSSARKWNVETPICPKCSNRVYFAEQVNYITTHSFTYSIESFSKGKGCG